MKDLLTAHNVSAGYGARPVLHDVSLALGEEDFLGVLGPNGSGKTTLVRVLSGLMKPSSGEVFWEGQPLAGLPREAIARRIAVVGQSAPPHLDLPVEEIVALGRIPHFSRFQWVPGEEDRRAIAWALAATETTLLRRRNFQALSGGEQQRVMIALALAQQPRVLLLDEPTVHLDVARQAEMLDLLGKMNRDHHLAILAVLHDLNLAGVFCRRLVYLKEGRIIREGRPREMLSEESVRELFGKRLGSAPNPRTGIPVLFPLRGQESG
jgi:iron complex transport system ATP-binding protein